ncbi:hypothetical protein KIN20_027754 [Parelaphostrongylus tenuis]|uniref:Uncharacterized protein n=1 Tax=Parelaphostrongylus tenuis TaxID=148309 RepID=A0AAD5QZY8_PARTN|nr:hypothetical protein KIN20_027754 [Parelaphostrongylus tenuis]
MEAEEYFSTYDALHKDDSTVRRLEIRLRNVSSIGKVVWSSFDFMCGPELKFVWEVTPSNSVSPLNLSSGEGSANDEESLVSSLSTQSAQYEDIDDPLQTNLTSTGELYDSMLMDDCLFRDYSLLSRDDGNTSEELRYLDELMQDSHISASDSNSTVTNSMVQEDVLATKSVSSTLTLSLVHDEEHLVQADEVADSTTVVDPVIGTPTELLNNSMPPSSDSSLQEHEDNLEMGSGATAVHLEYHGW